MVLPPKPQDTATMPTAPKLHTPLIAPLLCPNPSNLPWLLHLSAPHPVHTPLSFLPVEIIHTLPSPTQILHPPRDLQNRPCYQLVREKAAPPPLHPYSST